MLCLLIPQKTQVKDLNVYLPHLIYELLDLQRGLDVIDDLLATKKRGHQAFKLHEIVAWTIHDHLANGLLYLGTSGECGKCSSPS